MSKSREFQFSLKRLLVGIVIFSTACYGIVYHYEPHIIEDGRYRIVVDYSRTIEEMIQAGNYDQVHPDIASVNFPIDQSRSGAKTLEVVIVHLDKQDEDAETIMKLMNRNGLRPAMLKELLALGEQHPELQRQYLIFALGSLYQGGGEVFPGLGGWFGGRELGSSRWGKARLDVCRFMALRK